MHLPISKDIWNIALVKYETKLPSLTWETSLFCFLRWIVSEDGYRVDPSGITAVTSLCTGNPTKLLARWEHKWVITVTVVIFQTLPTSPSLYINCQTNQKCEDHPKFSAKVPQLQEMDNCHRLSGLIFVNNCWKLSSNTSPILHSWLTSTTKNHLYFTQMRPKAV